MNKNTMKSVIQWKFDNSFLISSFLENDKSYNSQVFPAENFDKLWYSFNLKPNQNGSIWIYFNCFTRYEEVKVDLSVKTRKNNDLFSSTAKKLECSFINSGSIGIELFEHKTFLDFKSKHIIIECSVSLNVKRFECNNCFLGKKLFNSDENDLKIIIGEKEIMAHKMILKTFSPIFKKMIEAQNCGDENSVIEIADFDFEIVKNGINFCYGISEAIPSNIEDLIEILKFSSKYEINDLKRETEFNLIPQISKENVFKISNVAIESNAENLKAVCQSKLTNFVKKNEATVMKEFENLDKSFAKEVFQNVCIPEVSFYDDSRDLVYCIWIGLISMWLFGLAAELIKNHLF